MSTMIMAYRIHWRARIDRTMGKYANHFGINIVQWSDIMPPARIYNSQRMLLEIRFSMIKCTELVAGQVRRLKILSLPPPICLLTPPPRALRLGSKTRRNRGRVSNGAKTIRNDARLPPLSPPTNRLTFYHKGGALPGVSRRLVAAQGCRTAH